MMAIAPKNNCIETISWCESHHITPNLVPIAPHVQKNTHTTQQIPRRAAV